MLSRILARSILILIRPGESLMTIAAAFALHGGALDTARRLFPEAPEPWIDLSTGINPQPYPVDTLPADVWARLPDARALAALEAEAARCYRCPPHAHAVAAPGTQAIIQRLPALLGGRDVRLLGPTYGEFGRVFTAAGATVQTVGHTRDLAGADVAIVVNPNNPDGRLLRPTDLCKLSAGVGTLVVDEAFMDALDPAMSVIPDFPGKGMIVLRSFGKFYGLAGLRLGFAVTPPDTAQAIRDMLGPWAVSGPALALGTRALADAPWQAMAHTRLPEAAARLDAMLDAAGFHLIGGTPLFRLVRHERAEHVFDALARAGILTRPFASEPAWLRFGLPGAEAAWQRLAHALAQ